MHWVYYRKLVFEVPKYMNGAFSNGQTGVLVWRHMCADYRFHPKPVDFTW